MSGESLRKAGFGVFNGYAPTEGGPVAIPMSLDFSVNGEIDFDIIDETARGVLAFVQSIWVDNSVNPNPLIFKFAQTNQKLVIPAFAQGLWPVICPAGLRAVVTTTPGAGIIPQIILLNVPMPMTQFGPLAVTINNVNASMVPVAAVAADHSSTVAVGGTSQALFAANAAAKRRVVYNPSTNPESLFVNFGGVAAGPNNSMEIMPGGYLDTSVAPIDQTAWTINNVATAGMHYVAKEWV